MENFSKQNCAVSLC